MEIPAVWIFNKNHWDTENAALPTGFGSDLVLPALQRVLNRLGVITVEPPVLYGLVHSLERKRGSMKKAQFEDLNAHGIIMENLGLDLNLPKEFLKQAVDDKIKERIRTWFDTRSAESTGLLVMIGGDDDYAEILDKIQCTQGFQTVLLYPDGHQNHSLFAIPFRAVAPWITVLEDYRDGKELNFTGVNGTWRQLETFEGMKIAKHVSAYEKRKRDAAAAIAKNIKFPFPPKKRKSQKRV